MSFPRYPKYKDSGVEWLGQVPEHWEVTLSKRFVTVKSGDMISATEEAEQGFPLIGGNGLRSYTAKWNTSGDTLVIGRVGALCGCVHHITENFWASEHAFRVVEKQRFSKRFFFHLLSALKLNDFAIKTAQPLLNTEIVETQWISVPPIAEQTTIAAFLDQETVKIDQLVAEQERLIEVLKEKRQAVISHAVTKGLNPKASMKSSGVDWLGDVPEHWEVKPLRYLGRCQNGLNIDGEAFGSGFPFVSYGDVYKSHVLPLLPSGRVQSSEQDWARYSVERGDIFFTRTSETIDEIGIASICLKTIPRATFAGFLIRFRPEIALDCSFSKHYFSNARIGSFFASEMNLVTRASLSQDLLKGLPVLLPPMSEQQKVGLFLDECVDTFNLLTGEAQRTIDLLLERRTALISAAVTGQIDVRK